MKREGVSFYDSRAYNRPLNLPGVKWKIQVALGARQRALLPGAVMAVKDPTSEDYQELGGNYGDDDFRGYAPPEPDEDDIPI